MYLSFEECNNSIIKRPYGSSLHNIRHAAIRDYAKEKKVKNILDIGCGKGELIRIFSRNPEIKLLIGIQMNDEALCQAKYNSMPQLIQREISLYRQEPMFTRIYSGNVLHYLPPEPNIDLVTMVEFIEHIEEKEVPIISQKVFGQYRPKFVTITTPNKDFNVFFSKNPAFIRNYDHKFEWTREQFKSYCENISQKYNYNFKLFGIGEHIDNNFEKGYCTQAVHFTRNDDVSGQIDDCHPDCKMIIQNRYSCVHDDLDERITNLLTYVVMSRRYITLKSLIQHFTEITCQGRRMVELEHKIDKEYIIKHLKEGTYKIEGDEISYVYEDDSQTEEEPYEEEVREFEQMSIEEDKNEEKKVRRQRKERRFLEDVRINELEEGIYKKEVKELEKNIESSESQW